MKISFKIDTDELSTLLERYKNVPETIEFAIKSTLCNHIDEVVESARSFYKSISDKVEELGWEIAGEEQNNDREL